MILQKSIFAKFLLCGSFMKISTCKKSIKLVDSISIAGMYQLYYFMKTSCARINSFPKQLKVNV